MKHVQMLAFILMNPFHLYVKHGFGIDDQIIFTQSQVGNVLLVVLFDLAPGIQKCAVISHLFQSLKFIKMGEPSFADGLGD